MSLTMMRAGLLAGALGLATAGAALAQAEGPPSGGMSGMSGMSGMGGHGGHGGAMRQACAADVQSLCPGIQPGGGRLRECLRQNAAKVSDGCKSAMKQAREARKAAGG